MSMSYGGIAVYRRDGEKLVMLLARKTGELPPSVAAGKNSTIAYSFEQMCGTLSGVLTFTGKAVEAREKKCEDL
jgi:hypothetical protein